MSKETRISGKRTDRDDESYQSNIDTTPQKMKQKSFNKMKLQTQKPLDPY